MGPVPARQDMLTPDIYKKQDPKATSQDPMPLRRATSTASFRWVPDDENDFSPPADYTLSHSYNVTINAEARRNISNDSAASAYANTDVFPQVSSQPMSGGQIGIYRAQSQGNDSQNEIPSVNWSADGTSTAGNFPGQSGPFSKSVAIGARVSVSAMAYPGRGSTATASSSAKVQTTKIELIAIP